MPLVNDQVTMQGVNYKIFPEYGLTFHFVTSDGIVNWHYDEGTPASFEYTFVGDTYFDTTNNANDNRWNISSMCSYDQAIARLDWKRGILSISAQGYNKFYFTPQRFVKTQGLFTQIVEYM